MNIIMYPHGGSGNRGCEAIVRSTVKILKPSKVCLFSSSILEDYDVKLDKICNIKEEKTIISKISLNYLKAAFKYHVLKDTNAFDILAFSNIFREAKGDALCLSIGGDNYCYGEANFIYLINKMLRKKGLKTVLWGCSVDEDLLTEKMINDLKGYSLIVARESITYNAMKRINPNTVLFPDPAFQLETIKLPLPENFDCKNTIGINISPMIIENEKTNGIVIENYINLIKYILRNTDMSIALIPHVIWESNDDRSVIDILYKKFSGESRVMKIPGKPAEEIKGYISRCRFFVGARTHSTIAAYSSCIPTLVVGYSVKAKGIAKDIFGTDKNYVLPVQALLKDNDLTSAFRWLYEHENEIRSHLNLFIPKYCEQVLKVKDVIDRL